MFNIRFYLPVEGGRQYFPSQGHRCDFAYREDNIKETGIYMIYPDFEDNDGNVILDDKISVNQTGTARMWILSPEMKEGIHRHKINIGTKGYFMEGSRRVGEVEVIKIVGLLSNN